MAIQEKHVDPNRFFHQFAERYEVPRRSYARVDTVEIDESGIEGEVAVLLEGVDAAWFDHPENQSLEVTSTSAGEAFARAPLVIFEVWSTEMEEDQWKSLMKEGWFVPGGWVVIDRSTEGIGSIAVTAYTSLMGVATQETVNITRAARNLAERLDKSFSLEKVRKATESDIQAMLKLEKAVDFVNVLDVGQGNACALWGQNGGALLYFDLGGGVLGNIRTFPKNLDDMCFSEWPTIVLSHWDWDHWSSALRFPHAMDMDWLAPMQKIGPVHAAFAWDLVRRDNLVIWPEGLESAAEGGITIKRCSGLARNDSGLAMEVRRMVDGRERVVLLPGDAEYCYVPGMSDIPTYDGAVVSHHGSALVSASMLKPGGEGSGLVYSVGHGNIFGHPRLHAELSYLQSGWLPQRTLSTTQSRRRRPCNVALSFLDGRTSTACQSCGPKHFLRI